MKRLVHAVFVVAAIPAALAVIASIALRNAGGWVIRKEQELRQ